MKRRINKIKVIWEIHPSSEAESRLDSAFGSLFDQTAPQQLKAEATEPEKNAHSNKNPNKTEPDSALPF